MSLGGAGERRIDRRPQQVGDEGIGTGVDRGWLAAEKIIVAAENPGKCRQIGAAEGIDFLARMPADTLA